MSLFANRTCRAWPCSRLGSALCASAAAVCSGARIALRSERLAASGPSSSTSGSGASPRYAAAKDESVASARPAPVVTFCTLKPVRHFLLCLFPAIASASSSVAATILTVASGVRSSGFEWGAYRLASQDGVGGEGLQGFRVSLRGHAASRLCCCLPQKWLHDAWQLTGYERHLGSLERGMRI